MAAKTGRPSTFSRKAVDAILERLCEGDSMRKICGSPDAPNRHTVRAWCSNSPELSAQIDAARFQGILSHADSLIDIADDQSIDVASRKLMIDTRWRLLTQLLPKHYGASENIGNKALLQQQQETKALADQRADAHDPTMADALKAWRYAREGGLPKSHKDED